MPGPARAVYDWRMADERTTRRRALTVIAGVGATGVAVAALPAARLAAAPALGAAREARWIAVAKLAELPENSPRRVKVIADETDGYTTAKAVPLGSVYLVRKGAEVRALSATCPHLGCTVDLAPDGLQYFCPCHTSFFEPDGSIKPGKPNKALRGMDPLATRIVGPDKVVEVQFQRFALGKATREVLG